MRTWHSEGIPQPKSIPWEMLAPHEAQAIKNHSQSLEKLAHRGGLDPCEAVAILENKSFIERWPSSADNGRDTTREAIKRLTELVAIHTR